MATKKRRKEDEVEERLPDVPLTGEEWVGADNGMWCDLAVDSDSETGLFWLRKRLKDNTYFLIVAVVGGHFLKMALNKEEAQHLYHAMKTKTTYEVAFGKKSK